MLLWQTGNLKLNILDKSYRYHQSIDFCFLTSQYWENNGTQISSYKE